MVYRFNMKEWLHTPPAKRLHTPATRNGGKCPDASHEEITSRARVNPARVGPT